MVDRNKNYYEILEVPTDASPEEVYEGYLRSKNAYSQDSLALYSLMTKEECRAMLDTIEEAYAIISDPAKRGAYDQARGISVTYFQKNNNSRNNFPKPEKTFVQTQQEEASNTQTSAPESSDNKRITKIVATGKYALDFERDNDFEKLIETATEFTGELLRKIREYKKVDINRMCDMTKVSKTYLINIEAENLEKLPAPAYIRGFVYQYAKCLKLNPDLVATSYLHRIKHLTGK